MADGDTNHKHDEDEKLEKVDTFTAESNERTSAEINIEDLDENERLELSLSPRGSIGKRTQNITLTLGGHHNLRIEGPPENLEKGDEWKISQEQLGRMAEDQNKIASIRGKILSYSTEIEECLGETIQALFFGSKTSKGSNMFQTHILKTRSFGFYEKWRLFRSLTKEHDQIQVSDLRRKLKISMDVRNKFAHGVVIFIDKEPYIQYFDDSEVKYKKITDEYLKEKEKNLKEALDSLNSLSHEAIDGTLESFSEKS